MNRHASLIGMVVALIAVSAAAQTVNGTGTTLDTVPMVTATGSNPATTTFGNSPIAVSGSNVGIGTTTPARTLHVYANSSPGIALQTAQGTSDLWTMQADDTTQRFRFINNTSGYGEVMSILRNGNVGIGTTTPHSMLEIAGPISGELMRFSYNPLNYHTISGQFNGTYPAADWLQFNVDNAAGGISAVMLLRGDGNVGIGTTSPGAKLEVDGSVKLTANSGASITFQDGTTQSTAYTGVSCGGDYADSVDVAGDRKRYEPGDVLVLTADGNGDVARSAEPYSTMVAGIYSTRPGTVGRRQLTAKRDSEIPMAMVGIVPTRVSAENGPIHRGDLLVTASLEGYAMKGTDRGRMLGAVIGKAMGTLESGTGVIEVLVTLQ